MEDIQYMMTVMLAASKNLPIQRKPRFLNNAPWEDISEFAWNWEEFTYRIAPKFRCYTAEEFIKDANKHGWLKKLEPTIYFNSFVVYETGLKLDNFKVPFCDLLEKYTWIDGSACGVAEE